MNEDGLRIGQRIKTLRKAKGLSQKELAEKLMVSNQAVSNWERDVTQIDIGHLVSLAGLFHVSCDYLLSHKEETPFFLGIDGGGSKTEFVLFDEKGTVLQRFLLGPSNPNAIGMSQSVSLIHAGIRKCLSEYPSLRYVFGGIAGLLTGDNRTRFNHELKKEFPFLTMEFDGDIMNIFACDDTADAALIMGTGSCLFLKEKGKLFRYGGWGYLLDDAGSGYDIGKEAVRVFLKEEQERSSRSLIHGKIKANGCSAPELISASYEKGKDYLASFAHYVFESYASGDAEASRIIEEQVDYLSGLIQTGFRQHAVGRRILAAGGIIENYRDVLVPLLQKKTDAEIAVLPFPPVYGACRKCILMSGHKNTGFDSAFVLSYKVKRHE